MAIPFTCPVCGHYTLIEDRYVGRSGPCVKCGKVVEVPASAGAGAMPPETRHVLSPGALAAIGLAAVLFFAALCVVSSVLAWFP